MATTSIQPTPLATPVIPTTSIISTNTTLSMARGAIDILCKYNGFFLSFALAVGAMSVGYQPIAGIIFLASLVILLSISLLTMSTNFKMDDYNTGLTSYTFLYILFSSIYTNGVTSKSFGFISVILSAISAIINIAYISVTYPNNLQRYFIIYIHRKRYAYRQRSISNTILFKFWPFIILLWSSSSLPFLLIFS